MSEAQARRQAKIRWPSTIFLILSPLAAIILVPWYGFTVGYDAFSWGMFILFMYLTGISITAGYHRLWSHKSYDAHPLVRVFFAVWGACSLQNSILHWASDHRRHHLHVDDNEQDPYSAKRGFWYSHIGWIMRKEVGAEPDFSNVKDLMRDPVVMWQFRNYKLLAVLTNIGAPALVGWLCGDVIAGLLLAGLLRLVVNHHFTFFINSLAHIWGSQGYSVENTARDNGFLALFTYGEGYHNYHHRFQYDFRNGHRWWHYDPAKWLISMLAGLGLAARLKMPSRVQIEKARIAAEYRRMLARFEAGHSAPEWREKLEHAYRQILAVLEEFSAVAAEWQRIKKEKLHADEAYAALKTSYHELLERMQKQRRTWRAMILEMA